MKLLAIGAAVLCGALYAQGPASQTPSVPTEHSSQVPGPVKNWVEMSGKVRSFEAGQQISISVDDGTEKTYTLVNATRSTMVDAGLTIGDRVVIFESKEKDGPVMVFRKTGGEVAGRR